MSQGLAGPGSGRPFEHPFAALRIMSESPANQRIIANLNPSRSLKEWETNQARMIYHLKDKNPRGRLLLKLFSAAYAFSERPTESAVRQQDGLD